MLFFRVDVQPGDDGGDTVTVTKDRSLTALVSSSVLGWAGVLKRDVRPTQESSNYGSRIDIDLTTGIDVAELRITSAAASLGSQTSEVKVEVFPKPVIRLTQHDTALNGLRVSLGMPVRGTITRQVATEPSVVATGDAHQGVTFALPPR